MEESACKNGRKYTFWAIFGDMYWYTPNMLTLKLVNRLVDIKMS